MIGRDRKEWYVLDENNDPIPVETVEEWARWFDTVGNRIVGYTEITSHVLVSTVFLGIDHNWGEGPPILFETMVFGGPHDESQWRYRTYAEAKRGHDEVVAMCRQQKVPT